MATRTSRGLSSLPLTNSGGLSRGDVFDILRNQRRRYAFHYLRQTDGPVSLADLSEHVAAWECDTTVDDLDTPDRQRVYVSLLQTHLPKMDEADVVNFDAENNTVELAEHAADIRVYLEVVPDNDILWAQYYLGVTGIATAFLLQVWIGLAPFATFPLAVGFGILALFLLSAALHHVYLRRGRLGTEGEPI